MGDMGDDYRVMNAERKARHARWHDQNREVIRASGLPYTDRGEALLFREGGKPAVDFYPSTGRWRIPGEKKTRSGGAQVFLNWYWRRARETGGTNG